MKIQISSFNKWKRKSINYSDSLHKINALNRPANSMKAIYTRKSQLILAVTSQKISNLGHTTKRGLMDSLEMLST
jgi:hypothetical protein